jgi:hypothetical protein
VSALADVPYEPLTRAVRVSNEPLRERYLELYAREEITLGAIALELGWRRSPTDPAPDARRVGRALGVKPEKGRGTYYRRHVNYETAVALCRALDMDPIDAGI